MAEWPSGTVTFLFTDLEGSTQRWQQYPTAMGPALARHDRLLRDAIAAHGGVVFKTIGDAVCAAFASAPAAVAAALTSERALYNEPWGATGPLRARMALHTGQAEAQAGDYLGGPLNRVARLLSIGHGGQILLSGPTADLVADYLPPGVTLRDLGTHRLKDMMRLEHVFQLVAPDLPADFPPLAVGSPVSRADRTPGWPVQHQPQSRRRRLAAVALATVVVMAIVVGAVAARWIGDGNGNQGTATRIAMGDSTSPPAGGLVPTAARIAMPTAVPTGTPTPEPTGTPTPEPTSTPTPLPTFEAVVRETISDPRPSPGDAVEVTLGISVDQAALEGLAPEETIPFTVSLAAPEEIAFESARCQLPDDTEIPCDATVIDGTLVQVSGGIPASAPSPGTRLSLMYTVMADAPEGDSVIDTCTVVGEPPDAIPAAGTPSDRHEATPAAMPCAGTERGITVQVVEPAATPAPTGTPPPPTGTPVPTGRPAIDPTQQALGLVAETKYTSPQHGYTVEWDESWMLDDYYDPPLVSNTDDAMDTLYLTRAELFTPYFQAYGYAAESWGSLEEFVTGSIDPARLDRVYPGGEKTVLLQRGDDTRVAVVLLWDLDTGDDFVVVSEFIVLDDGRTLLELRMATTPNRIESAYVWTNETIRVNGAPPFTVLGFEQIRAALAASITTIPTPTTAMPTPTPTPAQASADGTYTSAHFGFSIGWDPALWTPSDQGQASAPDRDQLLLESGTGPLWVVGMRAYDGDAAACLRDQQAAYSEGAGVSAWRVAVDANGVALAGESDTAAWAVYDNVYTDPERPGAGPIAYRDYIECVSLGDGESVVVFYSNAETRTFSEHLASVRAVIGALALPG